MRKVIRFWVL